MKEEEEEEKKKQINTQFNYKSLMFQTTIILSDINIYEYEL